MLFFKVKHVLIPVLIHFLGANIIYGLFAGRMDSTLLTALTGVVVFPVVYWMYQQDRKGQPEENKKKKEKPWWSYLILVVLGIASNQIISWLMVFFQVTENFSNEVQEGLLMGNVWAQVIGLGVITPIAEEYIFRGLTYRRLKLYVPQWIAVLLGAGIFAVYHGNMIQILFAFPMALLIIWSYETWGTLKAPIVFHMAANASAVIWNYI